MNKEFICKGCGEKFNKDMQSSNVDYCYICNEFYMKKYVADLESKLAESEGKNEALEDDYNKLINQYNKQYNDLCKEIQFHSSARERFVKKVEELKQQLAEKKQELSDRESKWARWNKKDKIELLEKVRAEMYCMDGVQVNNYIDNLINELKEK